jgi:DNA-binding transcriptional LysR family regulator
MPDLDWNDLRYVLATARTGRLAEAARRIRVNETTISRRIVRLEQALGSRLFHRNAGVLVPTESGHRVVEHAERVELEIGRLTSAVTGADARASGSVRITSTPWLVNRLLVPAVGALHGSHPLITVELISDPRNLDMTKREADIAIRLARPDRDQTAIARRIATLGFAVYGPAGKKAKSLRWINFEEGMAGLPQSAWIAQEMKRERRLQPALLANDADVMLHAIAAGLGKSILPCAIGDHALGLTRLGGRAPVLRREVWLVVHPELRHLLRMRVVMEWIEKTISAHAR